MAWYLHSRFVPARLAGDLACICMPLLRLMSRCMAASWQCKCCLPTELAAAVPPNSHPQYSVHSSLDPLSGAPPLSPGTLRRLQQQSTVSAKQTPPRVWALPQLPTSLSEEDVTQQLALDRQQQRARQSPPSLAGQGTSLASLSSSFASLPGGKPHQCQRWVPAALHTGAAACLHTGLPAMCDNPLMPVSSAKTQAGSSSSRVTPLGATP